MTYTSFVVSEVINAAGAQSRLGGSLLSPAVSTAMNEAGKNFVHVPELHDRVGERIAQLTGNEAACISCGAAAGIMVAVAACLVGADTEAAARLPDVTGLKRVDVALWRPHAGGSMAGADSYQPNGYLSAVAMAGGNLRLVDNAEEIRSSDACVLWFPKVFINPEESATFDLFLRQAKALGVPFIVDAADQIPPVSNLWYYTRERGADLAIFSGGKGLGGPASSGLILGRKDLVAACRANSGVEYSVGRPAKVGKEELAGLLAAVEEAIITDPSINTARWNATVENWQTQLTPLTDRGVHLRLVSSSHSGQPIPRLIVELRELGRVGRDAVIEELWHRSPRVAVLPEEGSAIAMNPQFIQVGEANAVAEAVTEMILRHVKNKSDTSIE